MTLSILLWIYYPILIVFFIFNLLIIHHIYKMRYLGRAAVYLVPLYFGILVIILIVSHIFILGIDWSEPLFSINY